MVPPLQHVLCIVIHLLLASDSVCRVARSSKRLRGETVDKLSMYDNPELLARRVRQATQGESGPRAAAKTPRAVHFQQPLPVLDGPDAMEEEEPLQTAPTAARTLEEEEDLVADTPHDGFATATAGKSPHSGLQLTLSESAAQRGSSGELDKEQGVGSDSLQMHALHPASSLAAAAPNTTGKVLATSQDSLRKALDIAQGILRSDSDAAAAVAESVSTSPAKVEASGAGFSANAGEVAANEADAAGSQLPQALDVTVAIGAKAGQTESSQQSGGKAQLSGSSPKVQLPGRELDPDSSVLASTTRPNVPRSLGGKLAQLKAASSPGFRVAHAGHTPHPNKSRMMPSDQLLDGTPRGTGGSRVGSRDQEGATPAATLRPFDMPTGATPFSSTAGIVGYPPSHDAPLEDTPLVDAGHAMPVQMVPDSCLGQVCALLHHDMQLAPLSATAPGQ